MKKQRQPVIVGAAFAVLALIALVFLVLPARGNVSDKKTALETAQTQEQQLRAQVAALLADRKEAPAAKRQLAALEGQIPPTADLPGLIRLLRAAADRAAVDFLQVSPGAPGAAQGGYSTIPTQITTAGSYFAVTEFLYRLETLPRAVKVTNLTMGAGPGGLPQLQIQMTANLFTTDTSAGPGSQPGPTGGDAATGGV